VLGALFSAYHVILGIYSLNVPASPWPPSSPSCCTRSATVASLWPVQRIRMPDWLAAFDLAGLHRAAAARHEPARRDAQNGYATWYVAAVGHPDDDRGGTPAARGGLARRHRARGAERRLGRAALARHARRHRQHRVGRDRAHADRGAHDRGP
jgi:hypothetical protein